MRSSSCQIIDRKIHGDESFGTVFKVLPESVTHHVEEDESGLFLELPKTGLAREAWPARRHARDAAKPGHQRGHAALSFAREDVWSADVPDRWYQLVAAR